MRLSLTWLIFLFVLGPAQCCAGTNDATTRNSQDKESAAPSPELATEPQRLQVTQPNGEAAPRSNPEAIKRIDVGPISVTKDRFDYLYIIANLILTIATGVVAWLAKGQASAAKNSAATAEKALRLTERADVLLEGASMIYDPLTNKLDGNSRVALRFKNFGRTRANKVIIQADLIFPDDVQMTRGKAPPSPVIVLGAGGEQSVPFQKFRDALNKTTFEGIANGMIKLRFTASVTYEDVFGSAHSCLYTGTFLPPDRFNIDENLSD
jgi:hypothetical protein